MNTTDLQVMRQAVVARNERLMGKLEAVEHRDRRNIDAVRTGGGRMGDDYWMEAWQLRQQIRACEKLFDAIGEMDDTTTGN